jgi:hypothetical protein
LVASLPGYTGMDLFFALRRSGNVAMTLSLRRILLVSALILAAYVPVAVWLQDRYQPPWRPTGRIVIEIINAPKLWNGFSYVKRLNQINEFEDTSPDGQVSPVLIYENDKLLGPSHSQHSDIEKKGMGRYSHWKNSGLIFSTSDNTDPGQNGRNYWAVVP